MIISIINIKGGTSKTTTAMALATAAARDGKQVRVLDADPQSSATAWFFDADGKLPFAVDPANAMYVKMLAGKASDEWVFVDCPPNGAVLDESMRAADFIVVPTTANPIDVAKTIEAVGTIDANGKDYAVLMTKAETNTLNFRGVMGELAERGVSYFDTVIRKSVKLVDAYGNAFGDDLYGYAEAFDEIKQVVEGE